MKQVRDSNTASEQLASILEATRVDNDIVAGDYSPARVDLPSLPDVKDIPVKTASSSEDDESKALEVKSGTAESGEERGWYKVEFEQPFQSQLPPVINATGVRRTGEFIRANYEPPNFGIDGVSLVDLAQIEARQIQIGQIGEQQISVGQVSAGSIEVSDVQIADVEIGISEIQERSIKHQANISQDGISINLPELTEDINISDQISVNVDFGFSEKDFGEDLEDFIDDPNLDEIIGQISEFDSKGGQSLEIMMKEGSREAGSVLYDTMEDNFPSPDIVPGSDILKDGFLDAWSFALQRVYGAGETEYNGNLNGGEGVYESLYGATGAVIDDALDFVVEQLVGYDRETINKTNEELTKFRQQLVGGNGAFEALETTIEAEIAGLLEEELSNLNTLADETDNSFNQVGSQVDAALNNIQSEINAEIQSSFNELQSQINVLANEDIQSSLESIDGALTNTEAEINDLSAEVSEQLQVLSEQTNANFTNVTQEIQDQINVINDEVQVSINEGLNDVVGQVNSNLTDLGAQTNEALIVTKEDINLTLEELQQQVNEQTQSIQEETNESIADLEQQFNETVSELNSNTDDLENRINSALSELTAQAEASVNESLSVLYETMGMPKGELMVPVQVRNVSNEGFEFLGYQGGTKIQWTAMGRSGAGNIIGRESPGGGGGSDEREIGEIVDRVIEEIRNREDISEFSID